MILMRLHPLDEQTHGHQLYRVEGVQKQVFWPHDGDRITLNDAEDICHRRGWRYEIEDLA